jgi:hypothetical protein
MWNRSFYTVARRGRPVKLLQSSYRSLSINASEKFYAHSGRSRYQTTTCGQEPTKIRSDLEIRRRKWGWLGHTLRKPPNEMARLALDWNPQGGRRRGRPKFASRRTVLEEAKIIGKSWNEIKHTARNRWKNLAEVLCSEMEWWYYITMFPVTPIWSIGHPPHTANELCSSMPPSPRSSSDLQLGLHLNWSSPCAIRSSPSSWPLWIPFKSRSVHIGVTFPQCMPQSNPFSSSTGTWAVLLHRSWLLIVSRINSFKNPA